MAKLSVTIIDSLQEDKQRAKLDQLSKLSINSESMRRNLILTDVILVCGGLELPAHRLILAASSSYFQAMFTNGMKETLSQKVDLPTIDGNTMEIILDFMYTGNISVSLDNLDDIKTLLDAADQLQVSIVFNYCYMLMLKMLSKNRFLELWETANKYNNIDMKQQVIAYIAEYFPETSAASEFVQLPLEVLFAVINNDEMRSHNMDSVLQAVFQWVKYDRKREKDLSLLLSTINFQALSNSYLLQIVDDDLLMADSVELMRMILKTVASRYLKNLMLFSTMKGSIDTPSTLVNIPKIASEDQRFFMFKALDPDEGLQYKWYYPASGKESTVVTSEISLLFESAVCEQDGTVYFIGGRTKSMKVVSDSVLVFDVMTLMESNASSLQDSRYAAGAVAADDFIYVAGGVSANNAVLNSVERYDTVRDIWQKIASMTKKRRKPSLAIGGDKIYAASCLLGDMQSPLEYYSPYVNQWTLIVLQDSLLPNFKQGNCFFVSQGDLIHILTQSPKAAYLHTKRKDTLKFDCTEIENTSEILTVSSVNMAGISILLVVNIDGNIQKYSEEDGSWDTIYCLIENPTYALSLGIRNVQFNLM